MDNREKVAERLKAARSLAGYSNRKDFCSQFDISYDTLDAWERGKNPLTLKGAKRVVDILKSVEIHCTEDWLLEGIGPSPRPLKEIIPSMGLDPSESLNLFEHHLNLATELSTFTSLNKDSVLTLIKDNGMLPFYEKGDYVGGIRLRGDAMLKAVNKRCIIEFLDGPITVRQLQKSKNSPTYQVCALNKGAHIKPIKENSSIKIISAAPILWHRKLLSE